MDEGYSLIFQQNQILLRSKKVWVKKYFIKGILRGLETFSQMVTITNGYYTINETPFQINDKPRFSYRGKF
jgi:hypothetical protein